MAITAQELTARIAQGIAGAEVKVEDTTGTGDHFAATVVSPAFRGLGPVERHRLVYAALGDAMAGPIHALALVTRTPEEHKPQTRQGGQG